MTDRDTFDFFTYGSMQDIDVLAIVLGRSVDVSIYQPARLAGYRVVCVPDETYPVLVESPGMQVAGALIRGLGPQDLERIHFFEGEEYALEHREVCLEHGVMKRALVCLEGAIPGMDEPLVPRRPWSLSTWQASDKAKFVTLIDAFMSVYGVGTTEEAEALWLALEDGEESNVA